MASNIYCLLSTGGQIQRSSSMLQVETAFIVSVKFFEKSGALSEPDRKEFILGIPGNGLLFFIRILKVIKVQSEIIFKLKLWLHISKIIFIQFFLIAELCMTGLGSLEKEVVQRIEMPPGTVKAA